MQKMQGQNEVLTVSLILEKTSKTSEEMKAIAEKICSLVPSSCQ